MTRATPRRKRSTRKDEAMELTTFKLRGALEEFIAANADVDVWLAAQPGFRLRRIAAQDDGTVVDMLLWETAEHGERAAERLLAELRDSPVHAMIDHRTVRWQVLPVLRASGALTSPAGQGRVGHARRERR